MKKTVKQWFEECTEPWAPRALKNAEKNGTEEFLVDRLSEAISCGFVWSNTRQGYLFWNDIHFDLEVKESK